MALAARYSTISEIISVCSSEAEWKASIDFGGGRSHRLDWFSNLQRTTGSTFALKAVIKTLINHCCGFFSRSLPVVLGASWPGVITA